MPQQVELRHVTKSFSRVTPLLDFSMTIPAGALVFVHGNSGAGKTTLLRLIAGLEQPDRGTIWLEGRCNAGNHVFIPPHARRVSFAFQDGALWPHLNVERHLKFVIPEKRRAACLKKIDQLLDLLDLTRERRAKPGALSGGQQQRVNLARALAAERPLLLLDEPFVHLDANLRQKVCEEISRRRGAGITILIAGHELEKTGLEPDSIIRVPVQTPAPPSAP